MTVGDFHRSVGVVGFFRRFEFSDDTDAVSRAELDWQRVLFADDLLDYVHAHAEGYIAASGELAFLYASARSPNTASSLHQLVYRCIRGNVQTGIYIQGSRDVVCAHDRLSQK